MPASAPPGCLGSRDPTTFGPQVVFEKSADGVMNLPPSAGLQFFGEVRISARGEAMTVTLRDLAGAALHRVELETQK